MKLITISGATCTGKTLLSNLLKERLHNSVILSMDNYYYDKPDEIDFSEWNIDSPDNFDFDLLIRNIEDLKNGKNTKVPLFDIQKNKRVVNNYEIKPHEYLILDGLFCCYKKEIRKLCSFSIYINSSSDVQIARRIIRDTQERKRSMQSIIHRYFKYIKPSFLKYITQEEKYANKIIINNYFTDLLPIVESLINELP